MGEEIKNLEKAAKRIVEAIKNKEKIILYGDADLDGVSSVIVLAETIKTLAGEVSVIYFPDRESEGYGISKKGLESLKVQAPALLIALDCGISNFEEIKLARKIGFEVLVIDHHQVLDKLPRAEIIVDPKQKGDKYHFKELAAVGIVFRLCRILLKEKLSPNLRKSLLELTAMGTFADMMPQIEDNKEFIEEGFASLESSWRPGIKSFFEADFLKNYDLIVKISKIISILNVRELENNLPASFRLLTVPSESQAREIILRLKEKNEIRKGKIQDILEQASAKISKKEEPIIFEGESDWDYALISSVASFLVQKFKKPAFIFKKLKEESQGTVRVPSLIDSVALMKKCKKFLISYGGHAKASGFRLKNENLEKFKACLIKEYNS